MSSNAFAGVGTIFGRGTAQAGPFVAVAEINNIGGPDKSRNSIDVTSLDSTGGYREFIAGFRDSGQVTLAMNFTRATYEIMNDDYEDEDRKWYQIQFPDDDQTKFTFEGLIINLGSAIPADDKVTANVTVKISGKTYLTYQGAGGTTLS